MGTTLARGLVATLNPLQQGLKRTQQQAQAAAQETVATLNPLQQGLKLNMIQLREYQQAALQR